MLLFVMLKTTEDAGMTNKAWWLLKAGLPGCTTLTALANIPNSQQRKPLHQNTLSYQSKSENCPNTQSLAKEKV